jgi:electron transport complex protein RnfA
MLNIETPSLLAGDAAYYTYPEALVCALGAGVGFGLAMVIFSGVRRKLELARPPKPFQGLPITLIAAGISSLSFMGFGGLLESLFNISA